MEKGIPKFLLSEGKLSLKKLFWAVLGLWLLSLLLLSWYEDRGSFGDMFGAVNALFSGLAFAGVIYAIFQQKEELNLQRQDLELTRNEIKEQTVQFRLQNETLKKRNFEDTFFHLLNFHNEITNSLFIKGNRPEKNLTGKQCFKEYYNRFSKQYNNMEERTPGPELIYESFKIFLYNNKSEMEHYFKITYRISDFIDMSKIENKDFYVKFFNAQLSSYELVLIFYYSIWDKTETLKRFAEKYQLFCGIADDILLDISHRRYFYDSAFSN